MPESEGSRSRSEFLTGIFFSLTNPFALAFWLGLGAGVIATAHAETRSIVAFFAGFLLGAVSWCVLFAIGVGWGRRYLNSPVLRAMNALCGAALGYFGLRLLWSSLKGLRLLRLARFLVG